MVRSCAEKGNGWTYWEEAPTKRVVDMTNSYCVIFQWWDNTKLLNPYSSTLRFHLTTPIINMPDVPSLTTGSIQKTKPGVAGAHTRTHTHMHTKSRPFLLAAVARSSQAFSLTSARRICKQALFLRYEAVKQRLHGSGTFFGEALLPVLVVDVGDSKARLVAFGPLKVVHQRPGEVALHVASVLGHGIRQGVGVVVEVLEPKVILEDVLLAHVVLALDGRAILGHVHLGVTVPLAEPVDEVAEALGVGSEPERLRLGPDALVVLGVEQRLEVA